MAETVNLNRFRKARQKAEKEAATAANRARFGRTKAQKARDRAEEEAHARTLDGARRETGQEREET